VDIDLAGCDAAVGDALFLFQQDLLSLSALRRRRGDDLPNPISRRLQ
jgi:hypothetical protein